MTEPIAEPSETERRLREVTIGAPARLDGAIVLHEYDREWPELFEREASRVRAALGERALLLEHVGSTSVAGLPAKPIIDIVLVVADSSAESAYVDDLTAVGYTLRIREPDWHEHRLLKGPETAVNLHVFSRGCPEVDRMLAFRDRLRSNAADRRLYEERKRELAARTWEYVQDYADAKSGVIEGILGGISR